MALDAKISFMRQIEKNCADKLTVTNMAALMREISDVLQGFRMEELQKMEVAKDDLLDSYVASMRVQSRSVKTIARYAYVIGRFMRYVGVPTRQITVYHVRNWIAAEKERGLKDSTLEGNRCVLGSYFGWLFREGLIERNPMANVGVIKVPKKKKKTYSQTDIAKLNEVCRTTRDRAILHFLRSTGCRISEMTGLNRDQVDLDALECRTTRFLLGRSRW